MAAIERIDSLFDTQAILQEFALVKNGLADSQKSLVNLYETVKGFKDTTISNLVTNTEKLNNSMSGSIETVRKAAQNYDALTQKISAQAKIVQELNTTVTSSGQSYEALIKAAVRNKLAIDDLGKSQKDLKKNFDSGAITFEQYSEGLESIRTVQQGLKISNADITKALNNLERQAQASAGSTDELRASLNLLNQTYDKLSATEKESEGGQQLLRNIQAVDAAVKQAEASTGRFQRYVGNYKGAFTEAFEVLKNQLAQVRQEMGAVEEKGKTVVNNLTGGNTLGFDPNRHKGQVTNIGGITVAAGDAQAYEQLTAKADALQKVVDKATIGFRTSAQEARAFKEAAVQLGTIVGQDAEEFVVFNKAVGDGLNGINDIKAATKFQASDAKLIKGLADAASTLAGAFGAAQAAGALFFGENEDLQKQMAKFQQLLVLINGLQAVANGLQAESGGIQLLLSARTKLLNASKGIQVLLTQRAAQVVAEEAAATVADAEAKEAQAAATVQATEAEIAQTAALAQNTGASVANAAASGTAAKGVGGLATSLIATGIATLLLAAGSAIALLTAKLIGFGNQAGLTIEDQKNLAKATGDLNDALNEQSKILDELDDSQKKYFTNLLSQAQAAGASQYELLLAQQRYDKVQADAAKSEIDRLGATDAAYSKQAQKVQELLGLQQLASEEVKKISAIPEDKRTHSQNKSLEADLKLLDLYKELLGPEQKRYEDMRKAREDFANFNQKAAEDETKFTKLSLDEQLEVTEKAETLRANLIKAKNAIILGAEKSTLAQRIAAIKSNYEQEEAILDAQAARIRNNPSNFINGLLSPQAQSQISELDEKRRESLIKSLDDQTKIRRQYYERDRDAALTIYKSQLDDRIKADRDIQQGKVDNANPFAENKGPGLSDRLAALSDETNARRDALNAELKKELDKEGQTEEEKLALYKKYESDITALFEEQHDKRLQLEEQARQQSMREWDKYYASRKLQIDQNEADEIASLNSKKMSDVRYAEERTKIEDHYGIQRAQIEVQNAEVQRNATRDGTKERIDANDKLAESAKNLGEAVKKEKDDEKRIAKERRDSTFSEINQEEQMYASAITNVLEISTNAQKAHLEELEVRQQRAYEQQQKNITDSTASEEQKAIRLKILDDQRAEQKEINDRKQRQLDIQKAQFDKAKDIASIITGTALAVVKALDNGGLFAIPQAIAVGALGAAELAAAIATPIPHYKEGTEDHPGGPAVTGDGGVRELILEPGKAPRWSASTATLESLAKHTKVIPPHKLEEMAMSGMFVNHEGALVMPNNDRLEKKIDRLTDTLVWQTQRLEQAAGKNKPRIINKITVSAGWHTYIQNSVFK